MPVPCETPPARRRGCLTFSVRSRAYTHRCGPTSLDIKQLTYLEYVGFFRLSNKDKLLNGQNLPGDTAP